MEFVENLRHLGTAVHALRWVLLFIVLAPIAVTVAVKGLAVRTRRR